MAIGSGLAGSIGVAKETTYGTFTAPTKFYEFMSEGLRLTKQTVQGGGIAAGRFTQLGSQRVDVTQAGEGPIEMSVPIVGFGLILQQLMGTSVTPVQQATTTAYLQTHALADTAGKSLTVQAGRPTTAGTVVPYSFLGGKITQADFSCEVGGFLGCTTAWDFKDVVDSQVLAAPSYGTNVSPFHFKQMAVKIGTTVVGATNLDGVTGFGLSVSRNMKTDRLYANGGGLKAEPITNDYATVSGSITSDFLSKTDLADRYAAGSAFALVWEFTGSIIASTYAYKLTFELPSCYLDGETPQVSGPDVLNTEFPFTVQSNGADPVVTVKYQTTDVTL